jgi:hypothetical protein
MLRASNVHLEGFKVNQALTFLRFAALRADSVVQKLGQGRWPFFPHCYVAFFWLWVSVLTIGLGLPCLELKSTYGCTANPGWHFYCAGLTKFHAPFDFGCSGGIPQDEVLVLQVA